VKTKYYYTKLTGFVYRVSEGKIYVKSPRSAVYYESLYSTKEFNPRYFSYISPKVAKFIEKYGGDINMLRHI